MRIKRIEHVALAVESIDNFSTILESVFGLRSSHQEEFPDHDSRLSMFTVGESALELIEGTSPKAGARKWMTTHGQSIYHICFEVEHLDEALVELRKKGIRLLNDIPMRGHANARITFIDPTCTGGILFELAELPEPHGHGSVSGTRHE